MSNDTAVIIPNYNGIKYLAECIESLLLQTYKAFDIYVVDNGSTEEGLDELERKYRSVRWIRRHENGGFSRAVNDGMKAALSDNDDIKYYILLNNDTVVAYEFVEMLHNSIEKYEDAFSVQSRMISMKNKNILDGAGDFYNILGYAFARGKGRESSSFISAGKIFSSCAGAAIYKRACIDKIGYFDETHFAYLEDVDIGYRAKLCGYNNYYEPAAICYHAGSATTSNEERYSEIKVKLAARNSVLVIKKNQPGWQRVVNSPFHAIGRLVKKAYFKKLGYQKAYEDGIKEGKELAAAIDVRFDKDMNRRALLIEFELIANTFSMIFLYK